MARPAPTRVETKFTLPRYHAGNVFFVDSTYGENIAGEGYLPNRPLRSITYALAQCVDDHDDVIIVMNGYDCDNIDTETNGDDTPIEVNKNGVTIYSAGKNVKVKGITADDSIFKIDANQVTISALPGCWWTVEDAAAGTAGTIVEIAAAAVDAEVAFIRTEPGGDADGYDELITITATSHGAYIHDCFLVGNTTDTDEGVVIGGTADNVRIENNTFIDCNASGGTIYSAAIHTNCSIIGNRILGNVSAKKGIIFSANATGIIDGNIIAIEDTDANGLDPGACGIGRNFVNDAHTTSAFISPAAGTIT